MVKPQGARSLAILLVAAVLLISVNSHTTEAQSDKDAQLPSGDWSFSAHPYLGPGYDSRSIVVYSVVTSVKNGLTVTKVALHNLSSKSVSAVKLNWSLSTESDRTSVLLSGQTPLVALSGGLPAGDRRAIDFPVVSFSKIYKPLMRGDSLTGDFRLEVEVGEILYEDGSTQVGKFMRSSLVFTRISTSTTRIAQVGCAHQRCKFVLAGGTHYECDTTSTPELCTNSGEFCCNTLCGNPPCGRPGV